MNQQRTNCSWG